MNFRGLIKVGGRAAVTTLAIVIADAFVNPTPVTEGLAVDIPRLFSIPPAPVFAAVLSSMAVARYLPASLVLRSAAMSAIAAVGALLLQTAAISYWWPNSTGYFADQILKLGIELLIVLFAANLIFEYRISRTDQD